MNIILTEEQFSRILTENSDDRKINRFIKDFLGTDDFHAVRDFLLKDVYGIFPHYRRRNIKDTIYLINTCYDRNTKKVKDELRPYISQIDYIGNKMVTQIAEKGEVPPTSEDNSDIIERTHSKKIVKTPKGYTITRIDSQDELIQKAHGSWCVARDNDDDEWFYDYIGNPHATVYLATVDNIEQITEVEPITVEDEDGEIIEIDDPDCYYEGGDNMTEEEFESAKKNRTYPFDAYGLSELIVLVGSGGDLSIYSRWNLAGGYDGGYAYLTPQELSQLIGMDYRKAFPYVKGTRY